MILAGDVGGTKTALALFEEGEDGPCRRETAHFASREHGSLEEIIAGFLAERPGIRIDAACFGVAGPVIGGRVQATNLPWTLDEAVLARATGAARVRLLNDLEATAYGVVRLGPRERAVLNPGASPGRAGNIAVIAAGTGLGQAILHWDGERHRGLASEGGHVDFAPRDDREIALLRFLRAELGGRVSLERVLSGPGLHAIYRFLREGSGAPEPAWLAEGIGRDGPGAAITGAGLEERDAVCAESIALFASIYGAKAGDLALQCLALGGVFLAGGIAPKLLPVLRRRAFLDAFTDKGRFSRLVAGIEVCVALDPHAPLLGAAWSARGLGETADG